MKWLIILGLILLVIVLIASRYRKQIQMGLYVFRMFRKMRQMNQVQEKQDRRIETKPEANDATLVNCAKCGTWIPQNKAIQLRSGVFYCSSKCLETMAKVV